MPATAEQLKAIRKRAGIGEFKKAGQKSPSAKKTVSRPTVGVKKPMWDWDPVYLSNSRYGGNQEANAGD